MRNATALLGEGCERSSHRTERRVQLLHQMTADKDTEIDNDYDISDVASVRAVPTNYYAV